MQQIPCFTVRSCVPCHGTNTIARDHFVQNKMRRWGLGVHISGITGWLDLSGCGLSHLYGCCDLQQSRPGGKLPVSISETHSVRGYGCRFGCASAESTEDMNQNG